MRARVLRVSVAVTTALLTVLAIPVVAFAQGGSQTGVQQPAAGTGERGGLAATGFDAWEVGVAGLICIVAALVLFRSARPQRVRN